MERILYLDCIAGAAGDMLLAALLDAGADLDYVRHGVRGLGVDGLELELRRVERHGIAAARLEVRHPREHSSRTWADVRELIDRAQLPPGAAARALEAFRRLAVAEARVHGIEPDSVHFHEVGAVDALADVCGVALAVEQLAVDRVACSPLPVPRGFVRAAHGRLPLPAPATVELLRGARVYGIELGVELVTPTGAALIAALAEEHGPLPAMRLEAVGYGAGEREIAEIPNVVRVLLGDAVADGGAWSTVSLIETNLDDLPAELVPDAADGAFAAGALDVWSTPAQMKKGRPGVVLSALTRPSDERAVAEALMRGTSTLGLRVAQLRRWELARDFATVEVAGHPVRVKVGRLGDEVVNVAPEHDDCARVAQRTGRTVKSVWAEAFAAADRHVRAAG